MNRLRQAVASCVFFILSSLGLTDAYASIQPSAQYAIAQWIVQETKERVNIDAAFNLVNESYHVARKRGIDPLLLLAIMKPESNYNSKAANKSGARGLLQIIPRWHREKIAGRNIITTKVNIDVAAMIIDEYLRWHGEDFLKAMRRYSGGASAKYTKAIKTTYKELRDTVWSWHMENDEPMQAEYRYDQPRLYAQTLQQQEQFAQDIAVERLSTQHAALTYAYLNASSQ